MRLPWARALFIVLLCLSLGIKAWGNTVKVEPRSAQIAPGLVSTLKDMGFGFSEEASLDGPALVAIGGDCRIELTTASPFGWHRSAIADMAGNQSVSYLYAGRLYDEQPVLLTKLGHYWHKLMGYFVSSQEPIVRAIIISRGCAAQSIDAGRIAGLLG